MDGAEGFGAAEAATAAAAAAAAWETLFVLTRLKGTEYSGFGRRKGERGFETRNKDYGQTRRQTGRNVTIKRGYGGCGSLGYGWWWW